MGFKDIQNIQLSYNSLNDRIVTNFYIPCLENAKSYKRAVGYFSSNILLEISKGLGAFVDNGGHMKLLVSPRLDEPDYIAIKNGYNEKEVLSNKIIKDFDFNIEFEQKNDRFAMLAYMISSGLLDIKVVALKKNNDIAMFHKKIGIMEDKDGNLISFSGSGNETYNGYNLNDEDFEVFCSWSSDENNLRCVQKQVEFDRIWEGKANELVTIPFPEVIKNKILEYTPSAPGQSYADLDKKIEEYLLYERFKEKTPKFDFNKFYDYQIEAINNWCDHDYCGIFDMATGTGKTYTGAGAICKLYENKKRLAVFICCPYTHLCDQWYEELLNFNINAIVCYGNSNLYLPKLKREVLKFKHNNSSFFCAIVSNASFTNEKIQELIDINLKDTLLLVDEAHNFGATEISKTLAKLYPYRLGLSATLERHNDEIGTNKLYNFFGEKCIEYSLGQAIAEGKLTKYKYYPIIVHLTEEEYDDYLDLSNSIAKCRDKNGELTELGKRLLIKRARIVAGAKNKLDELRKILPKYKDNHNMLFYCGAVKYGEDDYLEDSQGKKQIEIVSNILNKEFGIYSSRFTADENTEDRKNIITSFKEKQIQAIVAIKCLDEGVNIPAIETAFILASSTNPKEYIQRRGRVLRLSPGKYEAEIYDFITLPYCRTSFNQIISSVDKNLARKELERVKDFAKLSINPSECNDIIKDISDYYELNLINIEETLYE